MLLRNVPTLLKKVSISMPVCHGKKFTVGDGERIVRVLFYMLLVFDSLQFSVDCPTAPARRVAVILCFRAKSEGLGRAPGNALARFWSCRQLLCHYYLESTMLVLGPAVDDSIWRALYVHYSRKTARLFPNYALCFCGQIIPEIMPA